MFIGAGDLTGALYVMHHPSSLAAVLTHWYSYTKVVLKYQLLNEDYEITATITLITIRAPARSNLNNDNPKRGKEPPPLSYSPFYLSLSPF